MKGRTASTLALSKGVVIIIREFDKCIFVYNNHSEDKDMCRFLDLCQTQKSPKINIFSSW